MNTSTDQTADLWLRIDQLHLNYLKSENNTKKLDIRKKLEGYVRQYLYLVPQDRKFCSSAPSEIIWQSARWIPNFSALKAASAFEAIEKYAANLINQPWRKEYKIIKVQLALIQYGGFYKHQVENCLSGAEKLFHQLGYVSTGQETLELNSTVDQDKATIVARDCILAYVECQIVVNIVQRVSAHFPCTWEEALDFRRDHIGTTEQAVRALIYLKNQNSHQNPSYSQPSPAIVGRGQTSMINQVGIPQTGMSYSSNHIPAQSIQNPLTPTSSYFNPNSNVPIQNIHQYHDSNSNFHHVPSNAYGQPNFNDRNRLQTLMHDQSQIHLGYPNQVGQNSNSLSLPNGQSHIPTANLVDLQGPPLIPPKRINTQRLDVDQYNRESSSSSGSTLPGQGGPIPLTVKQLEDDQRRKSVLEAAGIAVSQGTKNGSESWDYVYRQLENSGYSKDQADRPDVLELLIKQLQLQKEQQQYSLGAQPDVKGHSQKDPRVNHDNYNEFVNGTSGNISSNKTERAHNSNAHHRSNSSHNTERSCKPSIEKRSSSSASKHLATAEKSKGKSVQSENGEKTMKSKNFSVKQSDKGERYHKPLEPPDVSSIPPQLPPKGRHLKSNSTSHYPTEPTYSGEESDDKWECQFCTFLNEDSIDICEMCAKSRLVSESSRTTLNSPKNGNSYRSQSALSHNSRQTPTHGSSNAYYSDEDFRDGHSRQDRSYSSSREEQYSHRHQPESSKERFGTYHHRIQNEDPGEEGIVCARCTLVNDRSLRVCEACGASLGLEPIDNKHTHSRRTNKSNNGHH